MILKFDHISFSCALQDKTDWLVEGYTQAFCEKELPNIEAKRRFLKQQAAMHDIALYHCEDKYPIEITAYPVCVGHNTKYDIGDDVITVYSKNPEETIAFYRALGFKEDGMALEIMPFMDQKKVRLQVKEAETGDVFLDKAGFGSLAFVVDKIERHQKQLEKQGYFVSDADTLTVNGKLLKICFASNQAGDIVELIGVR